MKNLIFTLLYLSGVHIFAQDNFSLTEGREIVTTFDEVKESIELENDLVSCPDMEPVVVQPVTESSSPICHSQIIEPASQFFYQANGTARSTLWSNLKRMDGPWKNQDFYGSDVKKVDEQNLRISNRNGTYAFIHFPNDGEDSLISVQIQHKDGSMENCTYPFSQSLLSMNRATRERWAQLSEDQQEAWVKFCKEYKPYEETAEYAQNHNWQTFEEDSKGREAKTDYTRCPANLNWKRMASNALCGGNRTQMYPLLNDAYIEAFPNLGIPKTFMYFFDGYGDFNAARAKVSVAAGNVTGDEKGDAFLGMKNGNGLSFYEKTLGADFPPEEVQFLYYDGTDQKRSHGSFAAANCHQDMNKWINAITGVIPSVQKPKQVTIGYSNGGAAALSFQNKISHSGFLGLGRKKETQIDLMVTIDPISRPVGFAISSVTGFNLLSDRASTTARHINLYQDSDYGSFEPLKLRSRSLSSADENIYLTPEDMGYSDGRYAHVRILRTFSVQSKVYCEFNNVHNQEFEICE